MGNEQSGSTSGDTSLWLNPGLSSSGDAFVNITISDVLAANDRLDRFAGLLVRLFPELASQAGKIESELLPLPFIPGVDESTGPHGRYWVKADHALPIAGSVKARGGVHEVLEFTERLAREHGLLQGDDCTVLADPAARAIFARHEVAVGSTGNLGLSIGLMAAALGFRATVHMSADAKQWKKDRLRDNGVRVVEYTGDYARAVAAGREKAAADPWCYFVDDEQSTSLFAGYAVAAFRLQDQLEALGIQVDAEHPLFVYLPCGVGGAPAGITWGLKYLYGPSVHCFFIEPQASSCFQVRMQHPHSPGITVYEVGLDNKTEADGLAVPVASELAFREMRHRLSGIVTTSDEAMFRDLHWLNEQHGMRVEPSAASAFSAPPLLVHSETGRGYLQAQELSGRMADANHIIWTTGGSFVPDVEFSRFLHRGRDARQP